MYLTIAFVLGILGHFCSGVPLESPSSDFSQFFNQRIVGGSEAPKGQFPYMAALVMGHTWQSFVCGGSIITDCVILTAAHCIFENWDGGLLDTYHAVVGTNTWHRGTVVEFKCHINHPKYDWLNIKNDVGVLKTKKKIQMNERVAVIALNYGHVGGGEKVFVTGWGTQWLWGILPDKLQALYLKTITHKECVKAVAAAGVETGWSPPHVDPVLEICTLHSPGHGMCHGDSGSPLVSLVTGYQLGIVSWTPWACAMGYPDVHVNVSGVWDFIQDAIANCNNCSLVTTINTY